MRVTEKNEKKLEKSKNEPLTPNTGDKGRFSGVVE